MATLYAICNCDPDMYNYAASLLKGMKLLGRITSYSHYTYPPKDDEKEDLEKMAQSGSIVTELFIDPTLQFFCKTDQVGSSPDYEPTVGATLFVVKYESTPLNSTLVRKYIHDGIKGDVPWCLMHQIIK
jgi:hypothetical protein